MDNKANRQRNIQKKFFVSELENKIIEKNMREANLQNFSTYARKSCLDKKFTRWIFLLLKKLCLPLRRQI